MRIRKMWAEPRVIIKVDDLDLFVKMVCSLCSDRDNAEMSRECDDELIQERRWVFRGQSNKEWDVKSTIERSPMSGHKAFRANKSLEQKLVRTFVRDASCHMSFSGLELLDVLALMRHYGVPTRLVDFSESPFVALYFSTEECLNTDFCIWSVCIDDLMVCSGAEGEGIIDWPWVEKTHSHALTSFDWEKKFLDEFIVKAETDPKKGVFCAYPRHGNARQSAQAGLFLVPNCLSVPFMANLNYALKCERIKPKVVNLTRLYNKSRVFDVVKLSRMIQFVFPKNLRGACLSLLHTMNISPKMLYPGLEGIGKALTQYVSALDDGNGEFGRKLL